MVEKKEISIQFQPIHHVTLNGFDEYPDDLRMILTDQFANAFKEAVEKLDPKSRLDNIYIDISIVNDRVINPELQYAYR